MMMQRRHCENATAGELKTQHLHNDRDRLDDKNATDNGEEKLLLTTNRDHSNHPADGERPGVAHEHFGRMTIEPKESESGADERSANHREFTGEWIERDLQILRDFEVVVEKSEDAEVKHAEKNEPNEPIIGAGPEDAGEEDGPDDEHATHGGSTLFAAVQFSQTANFLDATDGLADFERDQFANDEIPKNQTEREPRHGRCNGTESDIKENVEPADLIAQAMEKEHHRRFPPTG